MPIRAWRACVALGELALDLGQPVPAVAGQLDLQVRLAARAGRASVASSSLALGVQLGPFGRDLGQLLAGQPGLEVGEVVPQRGPLRVQRGDLRPDRVVPSRSP